MRFNKSLKASLNSIKSILPFDYNKYDILNLFKKLYPYEWNIIVQRYKHYKSKDYFLSKIGKKKEILSYAPPLLFIQSSKSKTYFVRRTKKNSSTKF